MKRIFVTTILVFIFGGFLFFFSLSFHRVMKFSGEDLNVSNQYLEHLRILKKYFSELEHIKTPNNVRAVYYTKNSGLSDSKIDWLINQNREDINSVVIDVKEVDGRVFLSEKLKKNIRKLHKNKIYTIARIVVFKDAKLTKERPDLAIKRKSDRTKNWEDYKHWSWLDPGAKDVWDYNLEIAKRAYMFGFDEINFDYVRFPSDGNMKDIFYPFSDEGLQKDRKWGKAKVMDRFYTYITSELKKEYPKIKISADVFGQVAINKDDVNIGQILESVLLNFDFVSPMSYPSHYAQSFLNFVDGPDNHPYEVINYTFKKSIEKIEKYNEKIDNENFEFRPGFLPNKNVKDIKKLSKKQLRFWLQAFTCTWCKIHKPYTSVEINAQKKAILDLEGGSWMLWNAASRY